MISQGSILNNLIKKKSTGTKASGKGKQVKTKKPIQKTKKTKQISNKITTQNPKKIGFVPADYSINDLFNMTKSKNKDARVFANKQLDIIFRKKSLSGPEREQRAMLAKRKIGLSNVRDVQLNERLLNKNWLNAAKTHKLIGAEKYTVKGKINQKYLQPGAKMLPVSGSEPQFVKWLWGAKKKYIEANNCYAYAANQFRFHREHKAQPGENRMKITNTYKRVPLQCDLLTQAVLKDAGNGAYKCPADKPCGKGFYKIMLVRSPAPGNEDFHFYRQDRDGTWSHKQGWGYAPTKLDANGKVILDPRTANRNYGSLNYSVVCSSMCIPKQFKFNI